MRLLAWGPLLVVAIAFPLAFVHAVANPLPANGYGHSIYDMEETLAIPTGSTLRVEIGEGVAIPRGSLVVVTAGVMNRLPASDLSETTYFRLAHGDAVLEEGVMSPLSHSFETRFDSSGAENPQLLIRNDHAFDLFIDYRAMVIAPPTAVEHFALYVPFLLTALAVAALWLVFSVARGQGSARTG